MVLLRKLLFPFAVLYGAITRFRNFLYDNGILSSHKFDVPVIAVGNLSVGGTGKTPQIEYLIRLLSSRYRVATLNRGYKRKSTGFILADDNSTSETLGDEPYQFHLKFPAIDVAVDADRRNGIEKLLAKSEKPQVILLDDAFQHRKVRAGFYILLTSYGDLYVDDFLLPTGNLREGRSGAERADVIIVTKCPPDFSASQRDIIRKKLRTRDSQDVFFTSVSYDEFVYSKSGKLPVAQIRNEPKILVAGIAKPEPFFDYLNNGKDTVMKFADHHQFTENEILEIEKKAGDKIIITTEKDFVRLRQKISQKNLFYLPIESSFISDKEKFDEAVLNYVGKVISTDSTLQPRV